MPIYEYQCQDCAKEIEVLQKISDALLQDCPACGKPSLKKKVSAAAFRLKGGGWYETDFKTGDKKNIAGSAESAKPTSSSESSSSSSDSGASESKKSA